MPKATNGATESVEKILDGETVAASTEIVRRPQYSAQDMREIQSFDDALALMTEQGIAVEDATEAIGDGFVLLEDKNKLSGVPCLFMTWSFSDGEFGEFVAARVIAKLDNGSIAKYVVTDGSTGIYEQLRDFTKEHGGEIVGLKVMGGLRPSTYDKEIDGKMTKATTFYIETSKK